MVDRGCVQVADRAAAEVVVVNTCTVTAAADAQARDAIRKIHGGNPAARIIATGCYAQRAPEELASLPGVSCVVGNSHKPQIASLVASGFVPLGMLQTTDGADRISSSTILSSDIFESREFLSAPVLGGEAGHTRPTLKIQDGCNLRCAFCVIPFVRGKSRSMPPQQVIGEIQRLVDGGAREIVLSGINLGTYGRDLTPRANLLEILRRILEEAPLQRLRLSSIEPQDVTQDLIGLFASTERLAEHFHMPLQSGSDRVLAAMHRWYRTGHYARRVELIRERLPHAAIGADVIAGFPGETEDDHAETLAFIERLPFTYLHVFSFSARPGTEAAKLPGQVPGNVIKRRARELRALGQSKAAAFRESQRGRPLRVLTLRRDGHEDATPALSSNYLRVAVPGRFAANLWMEVQPSA
jgi:threonylcarbamoyladenosine tRNA methylthiotransferase MtaB